MPLRTAVVAGVSGISGRNLAELLLSEGWRVYGLARRAASGPAGLISLAADLLDVNALRSTLQDVHATHAFYCTWSRQSTETENCRVNGAMLRNFLDALDPAELRHVALVTGMKHYYQRSSGLVAETPFREEHPRLPSENFYYVLEDVLQHAASRGFSWTVHRPNTIVGYAIGNAMNLGVTLGVYAAICRETGAPFLFPGSRFLYGALSEITDAALLARHLAWAATTEGARNQVFNVSNGDLFRWQWLWPKLAADFGIAAASCPESPRPLKDAMGDAGRVWRSMTAKYRLQPFDVEGLAAWWHADADLGREFESFCDMAKSRRLGFLESVESRTSFTQLFDRLRREHLLPTFPPLH
jgi:nucleoside-diphosphate-sugar epimerase